jgi:nucleoside diphosphate kinase
MSVTNALLMVKPIVMMRWQLSQVMKTIEESRFTVEDMYAIRLTPEDVVDFYEHLVEIPDQLELESYSGGLTVVFALKHTAIATLDKANPFSRRFPCKYMLDDSRKKLTSYWFGGRS